MGKESIFKLSHADSSVSISIVSSDEKLNIFGSRENIDGIKSSSDLISINLSISRDIENLKGISEVEVVLLGQHDFGILELLLLVA